MKDILAQSTADPVWAALAELEYLHALKIWMNTPNDGTWKFRGYEFECGEAQAEYSRRKPIAWANATRVLAAAQRSNMDNDRKALAEEVRRYVECAVDAALADDRTDLHMQRVFLDYAIDRLAAGVKE